MVPVGLMVACHATVRLCKFQLRPISSYLSKNFKWKSDIVSKLIPLDILEVLESAVQVGSSTIDGVHPMGFITPNQSLTMDSSKHDWEQHSPGEAAQGHELKKSLAFMSTSWRP